MKISEPRPGALARCLWYVAGGLFLALLHDSGLLAHGWQSWRLSTLASLLSFVLVLWLVDRAARSGATGATSAIAPDLVSCAPTSAIGESFPSPVTIATG